MTAYTRRELLAASAGLLLRDGPVLAAAKPMRGIFIIMATPYTAANEVDYEDLAAEVNFLDRCGVQGMVWPQLASEYSYLSKPERMRGMEVLARAARGKKAALVLGVQGPDIETALEYARHAVSLQPDALIAMPPGKAGSLEDFRAYYRALARLTNLPFFVQTTGGAKGIVPSVEFLVELAREFPNFGYIKEEYEPVLARMQALAAQKPPIHSVFSGAAGKFLLYEMRLGFDGTMPGAPWADVYAQIWELYQSDRREQARDLFAKLLLAINLDQEIPFSRSYFLKKRGIFKTSISRRGKAEFTPQAVAEMDFHYEALKPYLRA